MLEYMVPLLLLAVMGAVALQCARRRYAHMALAVAEGDEDVKIASGHFSKARFPEDAAELAAQDFLKQKECGNIDRARDLGRRYALALLDPDVGPLAAEMQEQNPVVLHQQYVLYSYVVNRVIADHSPNSILAQTSMNIFYSEIESASPELYRHISDMAAFSLYILCERSNTRSDAEIGLVFAKLCSAESDPRMIGYGNDFFDKLYDYCIEEIRKTAYADT